MNKTSEKSKWFYSLSKNEVTSVILLAPGLNLKSVKMDPIAQFLAQKKCDVFRISLGDDQNKWTDKFSDSYDEALEHAQIMQRPLYFIGYSLGGLLGVNFILKHPEHQFKKSILMAPATHTKFYTIFPALLSSLFPNMYLPSFNLKNYRLNAKTKLSNYKKIHTLQRENKNIADINSINIPTLVFINPKDELISAKKLTVFSASNNSYWKIIQLTNKNSRLNIKFHHLIIDEEALGPSEWENLLQNLALHFDL